MTRIGMGYDAHAFADGRRLVLGGVEVAHDRGLAGHSDADVLAHALADAILGALREGDIGRLFPDSDPTFKDIDSMVLLGRVGELARERGFRVADADCVVIAQRPRLAPYRDDMRARMAKALRIDVGCIGLKATTTEHLGFEGREEGISAMAVVLLETA